MSRGGTEKPDRGPEAEVKQPRQNVEAPVVSPEERKKEGEAVAETIAFDENTDPELQKTYTEAEKVLKENPELQGPLANLLLMALKYYAIGKGYMDKFMPGKFQKSLDERFLHEKFDDEAKKQLLKREVKDVKAVFDENSEKASTKTACAMLGLSDSIESPAILAARLVHAERETKEGFIPYYAPATYNDLRKNGIPKGTVLIASNFNFNVSEATQNKKFNEVKKNSQQMVFVGLGDGTSYRGLYEGKMQTFDLKDPNSPISANPFSLTAAYVPNDDPALYAEDKPVEAPKESMEAEKKELEKLKQELNDIETKYSRDMGNVPSEERGQVKDRLLLIKSELEKLGNMSDSLLERCDNLLIDLND